MSINHSYSVPLLHSPIVKIDKNAMSKGNALHTVDIAIIHHATP